MRFAALFMLAIATADCGASLNSGTDAGPGGTGGSGDTAGAAGTGQSGGTAGSGGYDASPTHMFCNQPLGDDCSTSPVQSPTTTTDICTLDRGVAFACLPCGRLDGGVSCVFQASLIRGTQYSYIQIVNVDVAFIYVYDQNQKLVAKLEWSANLAAGGKSPWTCLAGPSAFDRTEAESLLPAGATLNQLLCST